MRVKFFNSGIILDREFVTSGSNGEQFSINPSCWYLRHFYNLHGKNKNVTWLMPEFFKIYNFEQALEIIEQDRVDVLCLSMFVWNYDFHIELAQKVKQAWPNIKIVIGGPELTAHKQPGFFDQHPYVDFVVYGDGEQAFAQLLDYFLGVNIDKSDWINIIENNHGSETLYPYRTLRDEQFFSTSPYLEQREFVVESLRYTVDQLKQFYKNQKYKFTVGIEFARGCMYSCTFCDWDQGLTKKVRRSKRNFFKDIDFFHEQDLAISDTDANFGQWDEDIEIFDYALSKYEPTRNFMFQVRNTPKLKKSATEHIIQNQVKHFPGVQWISMQDMDEQVLKNIDRPSVSLSEHYELINKIKSNVSDEKFLQLSIQLILGLPGQNLETATKNIVNTIAATGLKNFTVAVWELLANSPANNKLYQSMYKLKFDRVCYITKGTVEDCDLESLYQLADREGYANSMFTFFKSEIVNSGDFDWWSMQVLKHVYVTINCAPNSLFKNKSIDQIENIINKFVAISKKRIDQQRSLHDPLIAKYNIRLGGHYDQSRRIMYEGW